MSKSEVTPIENKLREPFDGLLIYIQEAVDAKVRRIECLGVTSTLRERGRPSENLDRNSCNGPQGT